MKFSESNLLPDYFWRIAGNPNSTGKKIYTPEHFKTNLYFFDKRAREFSAEAQHTADLLILSDYLYKVLVYQNNLQFVETFLSHGFFDRYAFLRRKLLFIGRMQSRHKFASRHVVNILLLLLCPVYEIRYRRAANIGWVRKQKNISGNSDKLLLLKNDCSSKQNTYQPLHPLRYHVDRGIVGLSARMEPSLSQTIGRLSVIPALHLFHISVIGPCNPSKTIFFL